MNPSDIIFTKGNKITFTTDAPEFKRELNLDEILDKLKEKFNISKFEIEIHTHPGEKKDKDISFEIEESKKQEVIDFILNEFYNLK
jgi:hypothetical protein